MTSPFLSSFSFVTEGFIHVDDLAPLSATRGLFSANTYLCMPPSGGDLFIWNVAFRSRCAPTTFHVHST